MESASETLVQISSTPTDCGGKDEGIISVSFLVELSLLFSVR
jgi:hypothetical protein